ncbi:MAG: PKD domain-containing protein [Bacteroidales bacterium]|nr:PKD domain-containing protein [Bacteroidales bacterium]
MKLTIFSITFMTIVIIGLVFLEACDKGNDEESTNHKPSCSIARPSMGEEITQGDTLTIIVDAGDEDGNLIKVRFIIDGVKVGSSESLPYSYEWATTNAPVGSHTIQAVALDKEQAEAVDEVDVTVVRAGAPPEAAFIADTTSIEEGMSIQFTDESSGDPTEWQWNFGDGSTGSDQNPTHTYSSAGNYTVILTVENEYGSNTETKPDYIEVSSFGGTPPTGYFTDPRDGQEYAFIEIGDQTWMATNLNYESDNSWWYNNDPGLGESYGRLYTWDAALAACPDGWHLPSDKEWKTLEMELGMSQSEADNIHWRGTNQGKQMKATNGWHDNGNGANTSGFNALPGGCRFSNGLFNSLGYEGHWWASTESSGSYAWRRDLYFYEDRVRRYDLYKAIACSVRCIKD